MTSAHFNNHHNAEPASTRSTLTEDRHQPVENTLSYIPIPVDEPQRNGNSSQSTSTLGPHVQEQTGTSRHCDDRQLLETLCAQPFVVAVDTEYEGTVTLLVQAAARLPNGQIAIQLYASNLIPAQPDDLVPQLANGVS